MEELDDDIYNRITDLSEEGNTLAGEENYSLALEKFKEALTLIPEPKKDWEASLWLYASIGDMFYSKKDFASAANAFYDALNCPDGVENPFVYIRLGECLFELGDEIKAREYLLRAYMLAGKDIFENEDEKYFKVIEDII